MKNGTNGTKNAPAITRDEADAMILLIKQAKHLGVAFFEGPNGIKFGFKRERTPNEQRRDATASENFIP